MFIIKVFIEIKAIICQNSLVVVINQTHLYSVENLFTQNKNIYYCAIYDINIITIIHIKQWYNIVPLLDI